MKKIALFTLFILINGSISGAAGPIQRKAKSSQHELEKACAAREKVRISYLEDIDNQRLQADLDAQEGTSFTTHRPPACLFRLMLKMNAVTPKHLQSLFYERIQQIAPAHLKNQLPSEYFRGYHSDCNQVESSMAPFCMSILSLCLTGISLIALNSAQTAEEFPQIYDYISRPCCMGSMAVLGACCTLKCCSLSAQWLTEGRLEESACRNGTINDITPKAPEMIIE